MSKRAEYIKADLKYQKKVRQEISRRKRHDVPPIYAFSGNACFIVKPED